MPHVPSGRARQASARGWIAAAVAVACAFACMAAGGLQAQLLPGDGVVFNGLTDYATVELSEELRDLDGLTVAAWVRLEVASGIQTFLNRGQRGQLFTLYLFNDHVRMLVEYQNGGYTYASTEPPPANTWIHYAGTYDGQTIRLYVNGVEVDQTTVPGRIPVRDDPLYIGATEPLLNGVFGAMSDVRFHGEALSPESVFELFAGSVPAVSSPFLHFTDGELADLVRNAFPEPPDGVEPTFPFANGTLAKTDGFRGLWYVNGRSSDGLHKYSGGLGTYPQQHHPIAIYAPEVNTTFFTYGGRRKDENRLLHMVSAFDHETGKIARPRILLDKQTNDAHDNPTMAIDRDGYIWIFSNAHGTGRPSYIHRSAEPYSIDAFHLQTVTNFSYSQPWYVEPGGFVFLHTIYSQGRRLFVANSENGAAWTEPRPLAHVRNGHYQISWPRGATIGTAFNYHPDGSSPLGSGLDHRTNLYYMESDDGGQTWRNVQGELLDLPLTEIGNPALAVEYESQLKLAYLKDLQYTADGHPVILHLVSPGWASGPENDPRVFTIARWTGTEWVTRPVTTADNNYDFASLYIEADGTWRIIGITGTGPQPYNTGGEVAMWISRDEGDSWEMVRQLTRDSEYNHTYPRRPLNAHPGFYAFWADGHGREESPSRFYFATRDGEVFRLPYSIDGDAMWVDPEPLEEVPPGERGLVGAAPAVLFESGGFENAEHYPPGPLEQGALWQSTSPAAVIALDETDGNKVLRRVRGSGNFDRDWLQFPAIAGELLCVELDIRVSDPNQRTLDLSLMPVEGTRQAGLLGWGIDPGFLSYYDGSNWVPVSPLDGDWHSLRVVHYLDGAFANRFDLFVDGALAGEKLRFRHDFDRSEWFGRVRVNASGPEGGWFEIDNLRVRAQRLIGPDKLPAAWELAVVRQAEGIAVRAFTLPGINYILESKDHLREPGWIALGTFSGTGQGHLLADPRPVAGRRFYRIRTVPASPE